MSYLHKRGAVYYTRLVVPQRLRAIVGKSDLGRSLGVKDRKAALRLLPEWLAEAQAVIADAEDKFAEESGEQQEARREARREIKEQLQAKLQGSTAEMPPELAAMHDLLRETMEEMAIAHLANRSPSRWREEGERREQTARREVVTLTAIFEGYAQQEGSNPSTVNQFRSIIGNLVAFLGHNDAGRITHADIVRWLEHLRTEPVNSGRLKGKPRSATTINESYLAAAKAVFGYGRQALLLESNPTLEVKKIRAPKKAKLREKDFSRDERKAILSAALEQPEGNLSEGRKLARRWVPWLCAYTGARVNEITQLRREDVRQVDGIWTIRITPEAGRQKTNEARVVPLHEHLIEQGFLAAIRPLGIGPLFYDPSRDRGGKVKPQSVKVGQFLATWVRKSVGITDPSVQPNHAWRHTFKTICRESGIEEAASDAISGHASRTIGRKYGSNSAPALARELTKFPRYEL